MRSAAIVLCGLVLAGCGGSPAAPSGAAPGFLSGTWRGTLTVGGEVVPTEWTFTEMADTAGTSYRAVAQARGGVVTLDGAALVATVQPAHPGGAWAASGHFGAGCPASLAAHGRADRAAITATLTGESCGRVYTGVLALQK